MSAHQNQNISLPDARVNVTPANWQAVQERLRAEIGDTPYENWILPLTLANEQPDPNHVFVNVITEFSQGWIYREYGERIDAALADVTGRDVQLRLVVVPPATARQVEQAPTPANDNTANQVPDGGLQLVIPARGDHLVMEGFNFPKLQFQTPRVFGLPGEPVMLPIWPETVRAVPNGVLRSALFGAIAKGKRRYLDGEELTAVDGVSVQYTGQRLDQGDLDVWESILHLVRTQALGKECRVTSYALLRLMDKTDTGKNRATLAKRITRLRAGAVVLKTARYTYIGGLVDAGVKDERTQEWVIVINPKLAALFGYDQYTQVDWSIRKELDGKPLAQWLHGFYSSHSKPYPMKADTLLRLAGSQGAAARSSHQTLRRALNDVATAAAACGQTLHLKIENGLVKVGND